MESELAVPVVRETVTDLDQCTSTEDALQHMCTPSDLDSTVVPLQVLFFGFALRCATLRVAGITTRSVVQLSFLTEVFRLDDEENRTFTIS